MAHEHSTGPKSFIISDQVDSAATHIIKKSVLGKRLVMDSLFMYMYNNTVTVGFGTDGGVMEHIFFHVKIPANQGAQLGLPFKKALQLPLNKALLITLSGSTDMSYVIEGHIK